MSLNKRVFSRLLNLNPVGLHILLLRCEGYKFPRNPNAHWLELFCNTHFYGPLVVSMNMNSVPYHLASFSLNYIDEITKINDSEKRIYPPPFTPTNSQKKNKASKIIHTLSHLLVPFYISADQKADFSDDLQNFKDTMDPDIFFMYKYKTSYCPQKNVKHDK